MDPTAEAFAREYAAAFRRYLADGAEGSLEAAYELGRLAVEERLSLIDLGEAHHRALGELLDGVVHESARVAAGDFFRESLTTFDIAARAFRSAQDTVRLEQEHAATQRALAEAAVALNSRLDPEHILRVAAEQAREVTGGRAAVAEMRLEGDHETVRIGAGGRPAEGDVAVAAPLVGRNRRVLGSLTVHGAALSAERAEPIVMQIASMASAAVENAHRYQRERLVAETLQHSLLPDALPELPGIEAAAAYWPAGDGIQVGGDFYDVFRTARGDWAILIGDVCGKGPAAASLTALTRYTARAAGQHEASPGAILRLLNAAMLEQRTDGRFATVLCALLRPGSGGARVAVASGGHPLPLALRADGRVDTIGSNGTLLGVIPEPSLSDEEAQLHPGDTLLLYTDGAIEVRHQHREVFGADDLANLLAASRDRSPAEILAAIHREVTRLSDGALRDDVALLALQLRG